MASCTGTVLRGAGACRAWCCTARAKTWPNTPLCLTKPMFRCACGLHPPHCTRSASPSHLHTAVVPQTCPVPAWADPPAPASPPYTAKTRLLQTLLHRAALRGRVKGHGASRVYHGADGASTLWHTRSAHDPSMALRLLGEDRAIWGQNRPSRQTEVTATTRNNLVSSKERSS